MDYDEYEDEGEDDDNDDAKLSEAHTRLRQNQLLRVEGNLDWCRPSVWSNLIMINDDGIVDADDIDNDNHHNHQSGWVRGQPDCCV